MFSFPHISLFFFSPPKGSFPEEPNTPFQMAINRSDSVSSFSTAGSSMFTDAQSRFVDAVSNDMSSTEKQVEKQVVKPDIQQPQEEIEGVASNSEVAGQQGTEDKQLEATEGEIGDGTAPVRTEQPSEVKPPTTRLTKEEKIKRLVEERKQTLPEKESDCHQYFFSNNLISVLDLPSITDVCCNLFSVCCNSTVSAGTNTAKANIK